MTVCLQDDVPGGGGSLEDEVAKEFLQDQVQQHAKVTTEYKVIGRSKKFSSI